MKLELEEEDEPGGMEETELEEAGEAEEAEMRRMQMKYGSHHRLPVLRTS
jgi:hypothetical protein